MMIKIGLALGSGSARGWAHIGIIKALNEQGIFPDIVCGTSVGALVGAAYLAGNLDKLEEGARSFTKFKTTRFFEINASMNGFISNQKLVHFLSRFVVDEEVRIEDLPKQYVAVATDYETGREIWLRSQTPLQDAVRASISIPGLFPPMRYQDRWLLDGALVNPVPISVCRALGADIVIAVNLDGDFLGRHLPLPTEAHLKSKAAAKAEKPTQSTKNSDDEEAENAENAENPHGPESQPDQADSSAQHASTDVESKAAKNTGAKDQSDHNIDEEKEESTSGSSVVSKLTNLVNGYSSSSFFVKKDEADRPPGVFDVITKAINVTQDRITRSRMAGDPPDILITPKFTHVGLLDFYRAEEAINAGYDSVERVLPEIRYIMDYQKSMRPLKPKK